MHVQRKQFLHQRCSSSCCQAAGLQPRKAAVNGLSGLTDSVGKQRFLVSVYAECLGSARTRSYVWTQTDLCSGWPSKIPKEKCAWPVKTVENHRVKKKNSRNDGTSQILLWVLDHWVEILWGLEQDFKIEFVSNAWLEGLEQSERFILSVALPRPWGPFLICNRAGFFYSRSSEQNTS